MKLFNIWITSGCQGCALPFRNHFYCLHSQKSVLMLFTYIKHNSISYIHIVVFYMAGW